jgi:hypothetical protein
MAKRTHAHDRKRHTLPRHRRRRRTQAGAARRTGQPAHAGAGGWTARRRNTSTFRCFGLAGVLRFACSVYSLASVWLVRVGMAEARVSRRVWRAVPRAAGRIALLPVAGGGATGSGAAGRVHDDLVFPGDGCPFIPEGAGRCQAGFRPAVSRLRGCLQGILNWPRGSCLSPRRCRVRASGLAGSRTGRSPAGVAGAAGVLDAGAREPMIEACGERPLLVRDRVYAVVVAPRPACGRAACWLRSSLRLSPGCPPGGMGRVRAGPGGVNHRGRPRRREAGGRMYGGLAPGRRPGQVMRPARAGQRGGRARRASRSRPG